MNKSFFALLVIFFSAEFIEPTKGLDTRRKPKSSRRPRVVGVKKKPANKRGTKRKVTGKQMSDRLEVQVRLAQKRLETIILHGSPRDCETVGLNNAVSSGANVSVQCENGNNLLHLVKNGHYAKWLIDNECNCNKTNSDGNTPFQHHLLDRFKKNTHVPSCSPLFALTEYHIKHDKDPKAFLRTNASRAVHKKVVTKTVEEWLEERKFGMLRSSINGWLKEREKE